MTMKLSASAKPGFKPVYLRETYPYTPDSDIYITSRILEIPEPFVEDTKRFVRQLAATKPVGYIEDA